MVGIISVVIGDHFGGGDHFDGGDHFGGGTKPSYLKKVCMQPGPGQQNNEFLRDVVSSLQNTAS